MFYFFFFFFAVDTAVDYQTQSYSPVGSLVCTWVFDTIF